MTFRSDSLTAWLERLEQLDPGRIELGLERVRRVAAAMNWPRPARVAIVAGTNGKGSCAFALAALCREAGVRCGCYTSPHLRHFRERIRVDGQPASDAQICAALNRVEAARGDTPLTYFEFGTLAAFDLFHRAGVDQWVLEVGLGGRLDAVNIIDADVAVITRVDLDHMALLGDTREQIGAEKAAVIRPGAIAVLADDAMPESVLAHCTAVGARVRQLGRDFRVEATAPGADHCTIKVGNVQADLRRAGPHPHSLAAAVEAFHSLGYTLPEHRIAEVLQQLALPGRLQLVEIGTNTVVLDVAHNPDAARWLATALADRAPWTIVLAMLGDKACEEFVTALQPLAGCWEVAGLPGVPRAAPPGRLVAACRATSAPVRSSDCPEVALDRALAAGGQRVLVCGSFYTVGRCLDHLGVDIG